VFTVVKAASPTSHELVAKLESAQSGLGLWPSDRKSSRSKNSFVLATVFACGQRNGLIFCYQVPSMGVGRGGHRGQGPLDFENWYFPINILVEKTLFFQFRVDEMKSHHCWITLEKSLWSPPEKAHYWPSPWKKSFRRPRYRVLTCSVGRLVWS